MIRKLALPLSALALILVAAAGSAMNSTPAATWLGWYQSPSCDDAEAQNPGSQYGCVYNAKENEAVGQFGLEACSDNVDNDSDEKTDNLDPDCGGGCDRTEQDSDGDCYPDEYFWGDACSDSQDNDDDGAYDGCDYDCPAGAGGYCAEVSCGNGTCEEGEDYTNCSSDCGCPIWNPNCWGTPTCGDNTCDTGEDCSSCSSDCGVCGAVCGNGNCEAGESAFCLVDCGGGFCGDGICASGESGVCQSDCGGGNYCGDGYCDPSESCSSCPQECGDCPSEVCNNGSDDDGDGYVDCDDTDCGGDPSCGGSCGDGTCDGSEDCSNCPTDCQSTSGNCILSLETNCNAGSNCCDNDEDDDDDGLIDCSDNDCSGTMDCDGSCSIWDVGGVLCEDKDCCSEPECAQDLRCSDGACPTLPNGGLNCSDPDCFGNLPGEDCWDGINNDGDCYVDCSDLADCSGDNQQTGLMDCNTAQSEYPGHDVSWCDKENEYALITIYCQGSSRQTALEPGSVPTSSEICTNGVDDDNDGEIDDC